jgi:hypothetical protein
VSAHDDHADGLARFLGRFSLGLGLSQVLAPQAVNRLIGAPSTEGTTAVMRGVGFRELAAGVGLLRGRSTTGWLWARAVGDAMDLALLTAALRRPDSDSRRVGAAIGIALGAGALDAFAAVRSGTPSGTPAEVRSAITVNRTRQDVYAYWWRFRGPARPAVAGHHDLLQVMHERRQVREVMSRRDGQLGRRGHPRSGR